MLKLISVLSIFISLSGHASVVLSTKAFGEECVIKDNQVIKTVEFHKGNLSFVTKKQISSQGLDTYARKAFSLATPQRTEITGVSSHVEIDGVKAALQFDDSFEARVLMSFLIKACNG